MFDDLLDSEGKSGPVCLTKFHEGAAGVSADQRVHLDLRIQHPAECTVPLPSAGSHFLSLSNFNYICCI